MSAEEKTWKDILKETRCKLVTYALKEIEFPPLLKNDKDKVFDVKAFIEKYFDKKGSDITSATEPFTNLKKEIIEECNIEDGNVKSTISGKIENELDSIKDEYNATNALIKAIFSEEGSDLRTKYDISSTSCLDLGGSGIIYTIKENVQKTIRVLKIPRALKDEADSVVAGINAEASMLSKLTHGSIIRVYDSFTYSGEKVFRGVEFKIYVMDYIEGAMNLNKYISWRIAKVKEDIKGIHSEDITLYSDYQKISRVQTDKLLKDIFNIFYNIVGAVDYMHRKEIIHFDIKPANILVIYNKENINEKPIPVLSDLGASQDIEELKKLKESEIDCHFTLYYSHPDLLDKYNKSSSVNNTIKSILKDTIIKDGHKYDLFALGVTIIEALEQLKNSVINYDPDNYLFQYLQLSATRMLDARNDKDAFDRNKMFYWRGLSTEMYDKIKYTEVKQAREDFKKQRYADYFTSRIPELQSNYPDVINSNDYPLTSFSPRVRKIVEHPILQRLENLYQLGHISLIFPRATHNRFSHSLGVFNNCCRYINALLIDRYNPFFKQIFDTKDIELIMVASLLHDVGHYPFSFDIEKDLMSDEVNKNGTPKDDKCNYKVIASTLFRKLADGNQKSENISSQSFVKGDSSSTQETTEKGDDQNTEANNKCKTVVDILEDNKLRSNKYGWGFDENDIDFVEWLITGKIPEQDTEGREKSHPLFNEIKKDILSSFLNSPVDIDKLDYFMRNAKVCSVDYGKIIDKERLIRNLTIRIPKAGKRDFSIAVYEKAINAAESLTFACFLLHQTLYWHHAARAVAAMMRYVVSKLDKKTLKNLITENIKSPEKCNNFLTTKGFLNTIKGSDKIFIEDDSRNAKEMLDDIMNRKFFKRVYTYHYYEVDDEFKYHEDATTVREHRNMEGFNSRLQNKIKEQFDKKFEKMKHDILKEEKKCLEKASEALGEGEVSILCDVSPYNFDRRSIHIVTKPKFAPRGSSTEELDYYSKVNTEWSKNIHNKLMRNLANNIRIFCHPSIREPLMSVLGPVALKGILIEMLSPNP